MHVGEATADTFNGFLEVLALPFKVCTESVVERSSGILPTPQRVLFELRLPFGF